MIGLYFYADWCTPSSSFTLVLTKLYSARKAQGGDQFEVVVVSRCQEAKATKHHCEDMPWLSMWHDTADETGMTARTSLLMANFGITSIPALVLLDKCGRIICADARDKYVADPEGLSFPWRQQAPATATAMSVGRRLVVNFDQPPRARLQPEPTCARPKAFAGGSTFGWLGGTSPRGTLLGLPVRGQVGKGVRAATTTANTQVAALGSPVGSPVGERRGLASTMKTAATAPQAQGGTDTRVQESPNSKRKSPVAEEAVGPPPPPKPNFDRIAGQRSSGMHQQKVSQPHSCDLNR